MPNLLDIIQSIQVPTLIKDEFIRGGEPYLDSRNRPIHYVGGFAVVFPFKVGSEKWAFRCWSADLGNIERRLKIISNTIEDTKLPYFCKFIYEPEGIVVSGRSYPTTRRKWIEGINLKEYICNNYKEKNKMEELANKFLCLCNDLHNIHIAHGDLQHANILVDGNGNLFLIDYDSFYVPELSNENDIISGLSDYQHPARKHNRIASEKLDYFSELVIYTSIVAIQERPEFVEEYDLFGSDKLLFSKEDFHDFSKSNICCQLKKLGGICELLCLIFEDYLTEKVDINNLKPFMACLDDLSKQPLIHNFSSNKKIAFRGDELKIEWTIENGSIIELNGIRISKSSFSYTTQIDKDTDYEIIVRNGLKSATSKIFVKAVPRPEMSIKLSSSRVRKGKNDIVTLNWHVSNSSNVVLYDNDIQISTKSFGELEFCPTETTIYRIIAVGLDNTTKFEKFAKVFVLPEANVVFTADKQYSFPGVPVQLSWLVKNAKSVELVGYGRQKNSGKMTVEPTKDTRYELSVFDSFGKKTYFVQINMLPVPFIETIKIPAPIFNINASISITPLNLSTRISLPQTSFVDLKSPVVSLAKIPENKVHVVSKPKFVSLEMMTYDNIWKTISEIIYNSKIQIKNLLWKKRQ